MPRAARPSSCCGPSGWRRCGAVELVREAELSPETLAAAMQRAAAGNPATVEIGLDGAARSAAAIAAMLAPRGGSARRLVGDASRGMIGQ